jgi:hypothetical protein
MKTISYAILTVALLTVSVSNAASKSDSVKLPEKAEADTEFVSMDFAITVPTGGEIITPKAETIKGHNVMPAVEASLKTETKSESKPQAAHKVKTVKSNRAPASIPKTKETQVKPIRPSMKNGMRVVYISESDFVSAPPREAPIEIKRAMKNRDRVSSNVQNAPISIEN